MAAVEKPLVLWCAGAALVGILHEPERPSHRGVVVVTGAPQYRAGSHRQFVLLARALAAAGFPVLRFDYRGMGDSGGDFVGFEGVEKDIECAVDRLFAEVEGLSDVVLWGLCDGASAAAFYAKSDPRIGGLVLLNPWVRTGQTAARARLSGYYLQRLLSGAFWAKVLGGRLDIMGSLRGLTDSAASLVSSGDPTAMPEATSAPVYSPARAGAADLPDRVGAALRRFEKPTLVILSGADQTAQEFRQSVAKASPMRPWRRRSEVTVKTLEGANHTYATRAWREQVHRWCIAWLETLRLEPAKP